MYARVIRATVKAIRDADPDRLVIIDGLEWGRKPVMSVADLGIGRSDIRKLAREAVRT